ncbi:transcriptional regulator GutM [Pseudoclavibacter helvolus]|uniref:transcriptional regulator GutM n=1 Tax=Pseudoclavibacter helvolus TaxID=255205 RepID=UPI0008395296|nr:transcriptional regulator GutM [Pseudoclavibacter helvolus]
MDWRFPAVLVLALVLSMVMSGVQMRAYMAQVNEIAKANAGKNLNLVSGRGKGAFRGAIAVLLVDPTTLEVVEARALVGFSVFGRLKPVPELEGPLKTVYDRAEARHKHLGTAVRQAISMLPHKVRAQVTLPPAKSKKRGQPTAVKGTAPKQFAGLSRISN